MVFDKVIELIYDVDIEVRIEAIRFAFSYLPYLSPYTLERFFFNFQTNESTFFRTFVKLK